MPADARGEAPLDEDGVGLGPEVPMEERHAEEAPRAVLGDDPERRLDRPELPAVPAESGIGDVHVDQRVVDPPVPGQERASERGAGAHGLTSESGFGEHARAATRGARPSRPALSPGPSCAATRTGSRRRDHWAATAIRVRSETARCHGRTRWLPAGTARPRPSRARCPTGRGPHTRATSHGDMSCPRGGRKPWRAACRPAAIRPSRVWHGSCSSTAACAGQD